MIKWKKKKQKNKKKQKTKNELNNGSEEQTHISRLPRGFPEASQSFNNTL